MVLTLRKIYKDTNKHRKRRKQNNIYQNKSKILKKTEKTEDQIIVSLKNIYKMVNMYQLIEIMLSSLHSGKNIYCWGQSLKEN